MWAHGADKSAPEGGEEEEEASVDEEEDEEEEARRSVSSVSGIYDERIASVYDLLQNLTTQRLQVIDTRSEALFLGKVRRGAKTGPSSKNGGVDRAGHIQAL